MPRLRNSSPFFMGVIDEDNRTFDVLGPLLDDSGLTSWVFKLRQAGRNDRCVSYNGSRASAMDSQRGYRFVDDLLAESPKDRITGNSDRPNIGKKNARPSALSLARHNENLLISGLEGGF